jgi:hypothetical protein
LQDYRGIDLHALAIGALPPASYMIDKQFLRTPKEIDVILDGVQSLAGVLQIVLQSVGQKLGKVI